MQVWCVAHLSLLYIVLGLLEVKVFAMALSVQNLLRFVIFHVLLLVGRLYYLLNGVNNIH